MKRLFFRRCSDAAIVARRISVGKEKCVTIPITHFDMVDPMRYRYYLRISKLSEVRHHAGTRFSLHQLVSL